jgi:hypothetical protein
MTDIRYTAAWVPDDAEHRPWEVAFGVAADWIEAQSGQPLLITPRHEQDAFPAITRFANTHSATTLRSGRSFRHSGPVLAYVPDYEMMDLATEVASDASLAVVETIEYPMVGWAMEVRAIDLVTGEVTPDTRTDSQRRELDRVFFYGNNGWAPAFDRERATGVLLPLLGEPGMSKGIVVGHMIAKGASGKGVARLAKVIDAMR